MFDIGFLEIVVVGVVALLVVGPDEFPGMVRNVGRGLGKLRGFLGSVKSDLDFEIDKANEIKQMMEKESEIARLHEIIEQNASSVPVQGRPTEELDGVEKLDESSQTETDQEPAQPLDDRRQT